MKFRIPGPWDDEPDDLDFEAHGLPCRMRRNRRKTWCGYVGLGHEHPLYGKPYNKPAECLTAARDQRLQEPMPESAGMGLLISCLTGEVPTTPECALSVHGGITFGGFWKDEAEDLWWYGFDTGHLHDLRPDADEHWPADPQDVYRDLPYVKSQTEGLARQLASLHTAKKGGE